MRRLEPVYVPHWPDPSDVRTGIEEAGGRLGLRRLGRTRGTMTAAVGNGWRGRLRRCLRAMSAAVLDGRDAGPLVERAREVRVIGVAEIERDADDLRVGPLEQVRGHA